MKQEYDNTHRRPSLFHCPKCHSQMEDIVKNPKAKASVSDIERALVNPLAFEHMDVDRVINVVCKCGFSLKEVKVPNGKLISKE